MPSTVRPDSPTATDAFATAAEGTFEDPEPPSRARRPMGALCVAAAAGPSDHLMLEIDAQVSPAWTLAALAAAALGTLGTVAATGLMSYSPTRLSQRLEELRRADAAARSSELEHRDREYFVVAAIYAAAGWILGLLALRHAVDENSYGWALLVWTSLMLFGTAGLPVAFSERRAERTVLALTVALRAGWYVCRYPLVLPLLFVTNVAVRALRLQLPRRESPQDVQKEVMAAVADNVAVDELADAERAWISNIVTLGDLQVSTVMTPRPDIVALPESMSLREAIDQALEHEFSRYPVYRERIDDVVGVFYVKDALRLLQTRPSEVADTALQTLLREPLFVPETTGAAQLLRTMQTGNQHMAIVIDEYGTTAGIATVEDLLEEIVGEIEDEYDPPNDGQGEEVRVVEAGRVVEVPGRTSVLDVNKLVDSRLSDDGDWETVAGLVIAACNRIPTTGETVVVDDVEFRVLEADERRVQRLRVTALATHAQAEDGV